MNKTYVNQCFRWLTNELTTFYLNNELPHELNSKINTFYQSVTDTIDWYCITRKDVQTLGFLSWEEDDVSAENGVWFIPNWMFPIIPEGIMLYDKNGCKFMFKRDEAPRETLYGCLTFGVKLTGGMSNDY